MLLKYDTDIQAILSRRDTGGHTRMQGYDQLLAERPVARKPKLYILHKASHPGQKEEARNAALLS